MKDGIVEALQRGSKHLVHLAEMGVERQIVREGFAA